MTYDTVDASLYGFDALVEFPRTEWKRHRQPRKSS